MGLRLIREPGFLFSSGPGLRRPAPLRAVPPARRWHLATILITAQRLSCTVAGFVVWRLLMAHGFLPARLRCRAFPFQVTRQGPLRCTVGVNLTYPCDRAVSDLSARVTAELGRRQEALAEAMRAARE
jgi:hypothetical protein